MHARRRLSYANVMSTIAVFLALGGGAAFAANQLAKNSVGSRQIKKGAVTPKKLSKSTRRYIKRTGKGKTGPQGIQGVQGVQGVQGSPGKDGATGSALLTGHATGIPSSGPSVGQFRRASVSGVSTVQTFASTLVSLSPGRTLEARDVVVRVPVDIPDGGKVIWDLYAQSDFNEGTPLMTCTIEGTGSATSCTAPGPATIPAGSQMWVRIDNYGGTSTASNPGEVYWGISLQPAG
jgi:hypothetical protein